MATTSWTTPSVAALLTGRYPSEVSPSDPPVVLARSVLRLPELFRDRGYATGAIVSHYFIGQQLQFDVGFDAFDARAFASTSGDSPGACVGTPAAPGRGSARIRSSS
jgi:arylsulfatase A-like enzyme